VEKGNDQVGINPEKSAEKAKMKRGGGPILHCVTAHREEDRAKRGKKKTLKKAEFLEVQNQTRRRRG